MSDFEPGPGWHEVQPEPSREQRLALITEGHIDRMWTRDEPTPSLPAEPYTVIRVAWRDERRIGARVLINLGGWHDPVLHETVPDVAQQITGFEVLAEPRAVTAKAILERVRSHVPDIGGTLDRIARDFGAES